MKSRFLLPYSFRFVGMMALFIGLLCIVIVQVYSYSFVHDIRSLNDVAKIVGQYSGAFPAIFIGLLFIGFSKEKVEDEHIAQLRLESLQWAIIANYSVLFYCFLIVSGISMLSVIILNLLTPIIFFIVHFRWKIWQLNRVSKEEDKLA